jgi:hypothetical protein
MADAVDLIMERMLPEFADLVDKGIFTEVVILALITTLSNTCGSHDCRQR